MNRRILLALTCFGLSAPSASAAVAIGAHGGTLGVGADITIRTPAPPVNIRVGFNIFEYSYDTEKDDINYEFDLHMRNVSALLDLHPFGGAFRLSGGAVINENKIDGVATPSGSYEIGDSTYPAALVGSLTGEMTFNRLAPYAGIGFGNAVKAGSHFTLSLDLGVLFQGRPTALLTATGPIALVPQFMDDLRKEEQSLNDDIGEYRFYPVFALGLAYQF